MLQAVINNMLQTVIFPYIFMHVTLTTYRKHDWLVNRTLLFTVYTYDDRKIYKTWMPCQSYFIVLTVCTHNTCNIYRLPPSVRLTHFHPNKNGGARIMTPYVTVYYLKFVDWLGYQDKIKLNIQSIWTNHKLTHTNNKWLIIWIILWNIAYIQKYIVKNFWMFSKIKTVVENHWLTDVLHVIFWAPSTSLEKTFHN